MSVVLESAYFNRLRMLLSEMNRSTYLTIRGVDRGELACRRYPRGRISASELHANVGGRMIIIGASQYDNSVIYLGSTVPPHLNAPTNNTLHSVRGFRPGVHKLVLPDGNIQAIRAAARSLVGYHINVRGITRHFHVTNERCEDGHVILDTDFGTDQIVLVPGTRIVVGSDVVYYDDGDYYESDSYPFGNDDEDADDYPPDDPYYD